MLDEDSALSGSARGPSRSSRCDRAGRCYIGQHMDHRLREIRTKLDRLHDADRQHRVFGARRVGNYGHQYRERPVLSADAVADLEADYGVTLPAELRAFLQTVHSGGPGPGYGFALRGERTRAVRSFPYTMKDFDALMGRRQQDRYASLPMQDDDDNDWPPGYGFLSIAEQGCGATDALIVSGELSGTVWCCDMAWRPYTVSERLCTFLDWYEGWLDVNLTDKARAALQNP